MILDYDTRPDATFDEKIRSLRDSIQLALNELESYAEGQKTKGNADTALRIARQALAAATGGAEPATSLPLMDGTAAIGTDTKYARGDHRHPTDTSRASASDLSALTTTVSGKVDKETGKGLSTNDYTDTEKDKLAGIEEGAQVNRIPFGHVDSTSTATRFTATVEGITELVDGTSVMLKNGVVNSTTNFTLNVNGLGAKPVYSNLAAAARDTTIFNSAYTMLFVYDSTRVSGGAWVCYRGYDSNTNTIGYQLRTNNTNRNVSDTARYYKLYFTSADGLTWVPASVNSTNNATSARPVNQRPIDPFGRIVYTSSNAAFTAGSNLAAGSIWDQYNITLGYSFNRTGAALTLTNERPVYVKCAPQADGSAIMDADTPIVQALPSTDDGKIYIFLGIATSATSIELVPHHPVYWHDGTGVRLWTGARPSGGGGITVDTAMSDTSENAVQNKVIKDYVDSSIPTIPEWTLAGSVTGQTWLTGIPATAKEVYIEVYTGNHTAMYSGVYLRDSMTTGVLNIGGYYISASDYGLCNVNIANNGTEVQIRNHRYGGTNYTTTATMRVFYR